MHQYKGKLIYRRRIVQTAGRCAMTLISRGETQKASNLLSMVHHYAEALDTHVQGLYRFAWAYLDYRNGKIEGQKEMLRVIALFDFLEVPISRDFAQFCWSNGIGLTNKKELFKTYQIVTVGL